jgi:hypothetical protein
MKRRRVLRNISITAALPVIAGCLGGPTGNADTTTTDSEGAAAATQADTPRQPRGLEGVKEFPNEPPEADVGNPDVECGDETLEYVRRPSGPRVQQIRGLELTASPETIAIGDEITFSLRNRSDEPVEVGNIHKYNIRRQTDGGWEPIFQTPEKAWLDDVETLLPGAGYDWPFTFSQQGLERNHPPAGVSYHVCAPLEPGTYSFAFWGATSDDVPEELLGTTVAVESP